MSNIVNFVDQLMAFVRKGKVGKRTCQVETSPWGHQTRQVEQGPRTPLERAAHVVSTQD